MGRNYQALTDFLDALTDDAVDLTFEALDDLVGGLPSSARKHAAWWSNSRASQPHSRWWLDAGRRASPQFDSDLVRFELGDERTADRSPPAATGKPPLESTGDRVGVEVAFEWMSGGPVTLEPAHRPLFPSLPARPAVYRLTLTNREGQHLGIYIGESIDVRRRMRNYRNPGSTQQSSQRVHGRLLQVLGDEGNVDLAVAFDVLLDGEPLDLSHKPARLLAENAALVRASLAALPVENL